YPLPHSSPGSHPIGSANGEPWNELPHPDLLGSAIAATLDAGQPINPSLAAPHRSQKARQKQITGRPKPTNPKCAPSVVPRPLENANGSRIEVPPVLLKFRVP